MVKESNEKIINILLIGFLALVIGIGSAIATDAIRDPSGKQVVYVNRPLTTLSYAQWCQQSGKGCRKALLIVINAQRARFGLPRYTLDVAQSNGSGSCVGSRGHARAMAQSNSIWHTNAQYPAASFAADICGASFGIRHLTTATEDHNLIPAVHFSKTGFISTAGENVGESYGNEWDAIYSDYQQMFAEGPSGGHYQNLMSRQFTRIGLDFEQSNGVWYICQDFTG